MLTIRFGEQRDVDQLVALESALFATDAVAHEPLADPTWPEREGRRDFERLLADDRCLVLVADTATQQLAGHLVGYLATSSPTRLPASYAILRSLYVDPRLQRASIGSMLVTRFLEWATDHGCAEAHVDTYAANINAQAFYEHLRFHARTVSRVHEL
ncbi:MAG: GNAT family N-acetyltransferase [Ilumatobacteraceae bacterium]